MGVSLDGRLACLIVAVALASGCQASAPAAPASRMTEPEAQLFKRIQERNEKGVRELLAQGVSPNARGLNGLTALNFAVAQGERGSVEALVDFGADPNARDEGALRVSPLEHAASMKRYEIANYLIEHGADSNSYIPRPYSSPLIIELVVDATIQWNPQPAAVDTLRVALTRGANPNVKDRFGNSPLSLAVHKRHERMAGLLICSGALGIEPLDSTEVIRVRVTEQDGSRRWEVREQKKRADGMHEWKAEGKCEDGLRSSTP